MKRKIVYIAGPYRAPTFPERFQNIAAAWKAARQVWLAGHVAICPHSNTAFMCEDDDGKQGSGYCANTVDWIGGDCDIIRRCVDHLYLLPGWTESEGARIEYRVAHDEGIPIWHNLDHLLGYLKVEASERTTANIGGFLSGLEDPLNKELDIGDMTDIERLALIADAGTEDLPSEDEIDDMLERASGPEQIKEAQEAVLNEVYPGMKKFPSGAIRQDKAGKGRFDLISPIGLRRLACVYENGGTIHGDRNWEKGIPLDGCLDSALRHINQYREGSRAEDHRAMAVWNLFSHMHLEETGKGL